MSDLFDDHDINSILGFIINNSGWQNEDDIALNLNKDSGLMRLCLMEINKRYPEIFQLYKYPDGSISIDIISGMDMVAQRLVQSLNDLDNRTDNIPVIAPAINKKVPWIIINKDDIILCVLGVLLAAIVTTILHYYGLS